MKISWLILTYNRLPSVQRAIPHCMKNAGRLWDEMVWCDNGSTDGVREWMMKEVGPKTSILFSENRGVAKGYNACLGNARGTHLVITGCDMLMPDNWLARMAECFEKIPDTGIVTIYASPIKTTPERIRGEPETINGILTQPAMPIGRRMLPRSLIKDIGYFHEGFGLYGYDDLPWGYRAERVCKEKGLRFYNLPNLVAEHLGTEGAVGFDHRDEHAYWKWKRKEVEAPWKQDLLRKLEKEGWPRFSEFP